MVWNTPPPARPRVVASGTEAKGSAMDIEDFYEADERRRRSEEVEMGTEWHDADGARYELSWVADTGELYVMREPDVAMTTDPFGDVWPGSLRTGSVTVGVVGWIPDHHRLEQVLEGWPEAMGRPDSVSWLAERLRQAQVPRRPPGPAPGVGPDASQG